MSQLTLKTLFEKAVLIDTCALYAMADKRDQHHQNAKQLFSTAQIQKLTIIVTNATIIESYRLALHKLGRQNALKFLDNILSDIKNGVLKLERMSDIDEIEGQQMIYKYQAHDITLTDSISFCMMFRMGVFRVLGFDSDCQLVGLELYF